jgi:hypothetical protein
MFLTPLTADYVKLLLDVPVMERAIHKFIGTPIEKFYRSTTNTAVQVEPKKSEFITAVCNNGTMVGNGNSPVDVYIPSIGVVDVGCVTCGKYYTGEKSMAQKFTGDDVDGLFKEQNSECLIKKFTESLAEKMKKINYIYDAKKCYYLMWISKQSEIKLGMFRVNWDKLDSIMPDKWTSSSLWLKNVISEELGNCKIYKAKKRMELRLAIDSPHYITVYKE